MKKLLPLFAAAILFVGCEKIEGQLNITKDVKLVSSKGKTRAIRVGTYTADLKANTSKKITLRLNNDGDEKYSFNIPDGSIPTNGSFQYKSATVGQPVDLSGTVSTVVTDSDKKETTEWCELRIPIQVCDTGPNGQTICRIEYQTYQGRKWVRYFDRKIEKDITLSVSAVNSTESSGQFQGGVTWIDRVILSQGQCR